MSESHEDCPQAGGTPVRPVAIPVLKRLWIKLLLAFMVVAVVAVGVIAFLVNRTTTRQFELYVSQGKQIRAASLAPELAAYYARTGGWADVETWMVNLQQGLAGGRGQGLGRGQGGGVGTDRFLLADAGGQIVADSQGDLVGQSLSETELTAGVPIEVGGEQVGTLLIVAEGTIQ
jgi:hypothetical protein